MTLMGGILTLRYVIRIFKENHIGNLYNSNAYKHFLKQVYDGLVLFCGIMFTYKLLVQQIMRS